MQPAARKTMVAVLLIGLGMAHSDLMASQAYQPNPLAHKSTSVRIVRDDFGVPHIYARSQRGIFYGFGYVTAHDRLWQAELNRRMALGQLSEIFGNQAFANDVFARAMFGPATHRAEMLAAADSWTRVAFEAFAAGMNAWIEEAEREGDLPLEFEAFNVPVPTWTVDDVAASFIAQNAMLSWVGSDEPEHAQALFYLMDTLGDEEGLAVFQDTHWLDDPSAPTTVPSEADSPAGIRTARLRSDLTLERMRKIRAWGEGLASLAEFFARVKTGRKTLNLPRPPGSFALAIGPGLTGDDKALLLGGPQADFTVPQLSLEVGLHGVGYKAVGVVPPGSPFLAVGTSDFASWTLTTAGTDHWDTFVEVVNPDNADQYLYRGDWLDFNCRTEIIEVASQGTAPVELCESVHGPVLFQDEKVAFASANTVRGRGLSSFSGWSRFGLANSYQEFADYVAGITYNVNFLYADVNGNIAFWQQGLIPIRPSDVNPWLPMSGTGESDWLGFLPVEAMPHALNPNQGWLANWNNKPQANWPNSTGGFFDWGPVQRVQRLMQLVEEEKNQVFDLRPLKTLTAVLGRVVDTPSGESLYVFAPGLLDIMLARVNEDADSRLPAVVDFLRHWASDYAQQDADNDGFFDSPGVAIFNTWYATAVEQILRDELGPIFADLRGGLAVEAQVLYRLLVKTPAVPLSGDYLDGKTPEQAMTEALIDSLDELSQTFGSQDLGDWLQPAVEIVWNKQGLGTLTNSPYANRAIYTQLTELGKRRGQVKGANVLPPGQSGDMRSPHFADQLELFNNFAYKEMRLSRRQLKDHIESVERLRMGSHGTGQDY